MFGYLTAFPEYLSEAQQERYRACYCGLCRSLKNRHGSIARMVLNYDMTFLVLLENSLYEPLEESGEDTCPAHPIAPRKWWCSEASNYGADMNVALAYYKCMDDWQDDGNLAALSQAKLMEKRFRKIEELYPRQCQAMEKSIKALSELEKAGIEDADRAADTFGYLMSEILVYRVDRWSDTLRAMGMALGRFIYTIDACLDLDSDTFHNRYNPYRKYYGLSDNEQRFRDILKMLLGECLMYFDRLPLVLDADIMKNVLCIGLWAQFNKKFTKKKGPSDDSGSV